MTTLPRLSRELIGSLECEGLEVPPPAILDLPERVVQFGTGAFLRGFVEFFIDQANRDGRFNGSIVAVSSTGSTRDALLNEQDGLYTLAIQSSTSSERYRIVSALSRAISAREEWGDVLEIARSPHIELVVSNTTEVGISLDELDSFAANPPRSFPGKLTRFLAERAQTFDYDVSRGLVVLPCELIEDNGDELREIVRRLAQVWKLGPQFTRWLNEAVVFCNTLVDRIVPGVLAQSEIERIGRRFGYRDELLTACEDYALFAIQGDEKLRARLRFPGADPRIIVAPDISPYRERKVRVLNGAHSIVVPVALLSGLQTVHEATEDERVSRFLRRVVFDEIVPSVDAPHVESFAEEVIERFGNPHIRHALVDIMLFATTKLRVRIVPTILAYHARTGRSPSSIAFGFAAYLELMRRVLSTERGAAEDSDGTRVRTAWRKVDVGSDAAIASFAKTVCANDKLWDCDLALVHGFAESVADHLVRIVRQGVTAALDVHLTELAATR